MTAQRFAVLIASCILSLTLSAADLSIDVSGSTPPPIASGTFYTFHVRIEAVDAQPASNVVLTMPIPNGTTFQNIVRVGLPNQPAPECSTPPAGGAGNIICSYPTFSGAVPP